jgi:hypothetical protein
LRRLWRCARKSRETSGYRETSLVHEGIGSVVERFFIQGSKVMARLRYLIVGSIAAAACAAGAPAQAVSTVVPVYQGTAFVTAVAGSCAAVGDYYTMVYRQLVEPSNTSYGGGVSFTSERATVSYVMPAMKPLNSGTQNQPTLTFYGQSAEAGPFSSTGGFDLKISNPGSSKAPKASVTITGTVTNFFATSGCTVTIAAALQLRP